jgi:hypothetical protein
MSLVCTGRPDLGFVGRSMLGGAIGGAMVGAAIWTGIAGLPGLVTMGLGTAGTVSAYGAMRAYGANPCTVLNALASVATVFIGFAGIVGGTPMPPGLQPVWVGANAGGSSTSVVSGTGVSPQVLTGLGAISLASRMSGDDNPRNRLDEPYPNVKVKGYGKVPFPRGRIRNTDPNPMRSEYTKEFRMAFREWWYDEYGWYPDPARYELHHIRPLAKGGTNSYDNLVPLTFDQHDLFTNWWLYYP